MFLGPTMGYTCSYFEHDDLTLEEAATRCAPWATRRSAPSSRWSRASPTRSTATSERRCPFPAAGAISRTELSLTVPKVTINDRTVEVEAGTNLVEARPQGRRPDPPLLLSPAPVGRGPVPHVPGRDRGRRQEDAEAPGRLLDPGRRRTAWRCAPTRPRSQEAQKGMMEFFLINHPLDCPICDQAGECGLQDYSFKHGVAYSRFQYEDKRTYPGRERIPLGANVVLNMNRCIQCTRCVRFTHEIAGTGELGFFNRGARTEIGTFPGKELSTTRSPPAWWTSARSARSPRPASASPSASGTSTRSRRSAPAARWGATSRWSTGAGTSSATSRASTPRSTTTGCATTAAAFEAPRRAAGLGEDRGAVRVRIAVDQLDRLVKGFNSQNN